MRYVKCYWITIRTKRKGRPVTRGVRMNPLFWLAFYLYFYELAMYQCTAVKVNHTWKYFDIRLTAQVHRQTSHFVPAA